jgi:hypothetical protein
VGEREVQPGGDDQVVVFCAGRRVRDVYVAKLVLPAEPLVDFGDGAEIEVSTVLAGLLQVGIQIEILCDHRALAQFVVEFLAEREGNETVGHSVGDVGRRSRDRRDEDRWNRSRAYS